MALALCFGVCIGVGMLLVFSLCVIASQSDTAMDREFRALREREASGPHLVWTERTSL